MIIYLNKCNHAKLGQLVLCSTHVIQLQYSGAIFTAECNKTFVHLSYVTMMSEDVVEKVAVLCNLVSLALSEIKHNDTLSFSCWIL